MSPGHCGSAWRFPISVESAKQLESRAGKVVVVMGEDERKRWAMDRLPFPYSEALRLRAADVSDEVIAQVLAVEVDSVESVLEMAEAKLAAIRAEYRR